MSGNPENIYRAQLILVLVEHVDRDKIVVVTIISFKDSVHAKEFLWNARNGHSPLDSSIREFVLENRTPELGPWERKITVHQQPWKLEICVAVVGLGMIAKVDEAWGIGRKKGKHAAISDRSKELLPSIEFALKMGGLRRKDFSLGQHGSCACLFICAVCSSLL